MGSKSVAPSSGTVEARVGGVVSAPPLTVPLMMRSGPDARLLMYHVPVPDAP